jgi:hypothetical protein
MWRLAVGLAAVLAVSFTRPAIGESELDQIQDAEQPGSQINFTFGGGGVQVRRTNGGSVFGGIGRSLFGAGAERQTEARTFRLIPTFP